MVFVLQMPLLWGRVWLTNPLQIPTRCLTWGRVRNPKNQILQIDLPTIVECSF